MLYKRPLYLARWEDRYKCPLPLKLNTYNGCQYQCRYCYSRHLRKNNGKEDHPIIPADIDYIRERLENINNPRKYSALYQCLKMRIPIQIGPLSDPFQPAEKRYKATKKTLKLLREHNYPYMIITKGGKILDQYVKYLRDGKCVVHISISTQDPEAIQLFEPKAPPPTDRINSIKKLADNKITVQHRLWPILPLYNTTKELENLIKTTTRAGAKAIIAEYLRIFNYHHFKHWLGLEYIKKLKQNKIPYTKNRDHYKIQPTQQDQKLREIKKICEKHNTPLYSPTILHYNHHQTCCGTDPHLHNRAEWALQLCHHKIGKNTTYNEYITGTKCPYPKRFQRFWDKGKLEKSYYDVKFNQKNKTYTHNKYDDKQVTLNV